MNNKEKNRTELEAPDAAQTGPLPEDQNDQISEAPIPEVSNDARDPSRVPSAPGHQTPNLMPNDEEAAAQKEVLEGVDRAENDQRRMARSPSERPPEFEE